MAKYPVCSIAYHICLAGHNFEVGVIPVLVVPLVEALIHLLLIFLAVHVSIALIHYKSTLIISKTTFIDSKVIPKLP
jgi:hypothetical protein